MRRHTAWLFFGGPLSVSLLAACGGSGEGLDSGGRPIGSGGSTGPLVPTFQSIQDNVFTPICSVCHAGGAAPQGLRLDAANSYAMLVGVPSTEASSILRIRPGDPNNSYLIQKIEGRASVGERMPLGGPPLPASTIAIIRQWVTDGALRGTATAGAKPLGLSSVTPAPGDVVTETPARIVISLDHELDATRLDDSSVQLVRIPTDSSRASGVSVEIDLAIPIGNTSTLMVTPRAPLEDGRYQVVIPGRDGTGLSDIRGERLSEGTDDLRITEFSVETRK